MSGFGYRTDFIFSADFQALFCAVSFWKSWIPPQPLTENDVVIEFFTHNILQQVILNAAGNRRTQHSHRVREKHLLLCYFFARRLRFPSRNETPNVMTTCPTERSLLLGFCWHSNVCCSNGMYSLWVESLISHLKMSLSTPINPVQILTYSCSVTFLRLHEYLTKTS